MPFDRQKYFDAIRPAFGGKLSQSQVDGQEAILSAWELQREPKGEDPRFLAYELATTKHETASTMQPIEEDGKGRGQPYGKPDPETGQRYYGRGYVQLTWRDNYQTMTKILRADFADDSIDLVWHPEGALRPDYAAVIMFEGMVQGLFREPHSLPMYFKAGQAGDPFNARNIINGDRNVVPDWSNGVPIGRLVEGYYHDFAEALQAAIIEEPMPAPGTVALEITIASKVPLAVTVSTVLIPNDD